METPAPGPVGANPPRPNYYDLLMPSRWGDPYDDFMPGYPDMPLYYEQPPQRHANMRIDSFNLKTPHLTMLPENAMLLRDELKLAFETRDSTRIVPEILPPEMNIHIPLINYTSLAYTPYDLANELFQYMEELWTKHLRILSREAQDYQAKHGWYPWEENNGRGPGESSHYWQKEAQPAPVMPYTAPKPESDSELAIWLIAELESALEVRSKGVEAFLNHIVWSIGENFGQNAASREEESATDAHAPWEFTLTAKRNFEGVPTQIRKEYGKEIVDYYNKTYSQGIKNFIPQEALSNIEDAIGSRLPPPPEGPITTAPAKAAQAESKRGWEDLISTSPTLLLAQTETGVFSDASGFFSEENQELTQEDREKILEKSQIWMGVPYSLRGEKSSATDGLGADCSGSLYHIYNDAGLCYDYRTTASFPSYAESSCKFIPISEEELKPGDIVYWAPLKDMPGHLGLYISGSGDTLIVRSATRKRGFCDLPAKFLDLGRPRTYYRYVKF